MEKRTIVSTDWLAKHLRDPNVIVIDCRFSLVDTNAGHAAYLQSHIPAAYYVHLDRDLSGVKTGANGRHPLPDQAHFSSVLRRLGADKDKVVIAYDDAGGMFAARFWWMLRWVGLYNCAVLDGGWKKWLAEDREVNNDIPPARISTVELRANNSLAVAIDDVMRHIEDPSHMLLMDARSPERFRGENETIDPVGGHIPGASNRFYQANLDAEGRFKSSDELRREFEILLAENDPETVVHQCGSGVTACHNLLAMEIAGLHGSKLYPGSWSEWCADPSKPIAH